MSAILVSEQPVAQFLVAARLIEQDDGTVTVELPDGAVLSVQPDGRLETRPPGTAGPYERALPWGSVLVYVPDGQRGYALAYVPGAPGDPA